MALKPTSRHPVGRQAPTPRRRAKAAPTPLPPSLAAQKSDFTAEGAPPPGKVATTPPARSTDKDLPKR